MGRVKTEKLDEDDADRRQPKRRRSSRRKAAETAAKIAETARREADFGSDDDDEGELQLRRCVTEAEVLIIKKRLDDVPTVARMEKPPHDLLVRVIFPQTRVLAGRRSWSSHSVCAGTDATAPAGPVG
eukprot:COSAG03_NODE_405_length_8175_cov_4.098935_2_plen_128_part_00